jgi:hypothetical protein
VIKEKQFTVIWHVDDIKMSHVDEDEVTKMIKWLNSFYEEDVRVSQSKVHNYRRITWTSQIMER